MAERNSKQPSKEKMGDLYQYAKGNPRDIFAYALMIIGIILLFFQPIYGGLLIGLVVGSYFFKEITAFAKELESFVEREGFVRSLVLGSALLAFFISLPSIFIGAALVVGIKLFLGNN